MQLGRQEYFVKGTIFLEDFSSSHGLIFNLSSILLNIRAGNILTTVLGKDLQTFRLVARSATINEGRDWNVIRHPDALLILRTRTSRINEMGRESQKLADKVSVIHTSGCSNGILHVVSYNTAWTSDIMWNHGQLTESVQCSLVRGYKDDRPSTHRV